MNKEFSSVNITNNLENDEKFILYFNSGFINNKLKFDISNAEDFGIACFSLEIAEKLKRMIDSIVDVFKKELPNHKKISEQDWYGE